MKKEKIKKWLVSYKKDEEGISYADYFPSLGNNSKIGSLEFEGDGYLTIEGLDPLTTYKISIGKEIETEGTTEVDYDWTNQEEKITSTQNGKIKISFSGLSYKI